ncbi:MAG: sel1 repeat family protein, partial [Proteobacteria bacterium]|nr:sel1 repeat family protein [Pseudomonadota bacterium]
SVKKNDPEALAWFRKSARQGYAKAQYQVAKLTMDEAESDEDFTDAFAWFFQAAEQGHTKAQYHLGTLYANGKGIKKDNVKAYSWFYAAATDDEPRAIKALKKIEKKLQPSELVEALEEGADLCGIAEEDDSAD